MDPFSAFDMIGFNSRGRRGSGSLETGDRFIPRRRSSDSNIAGFLQRPSVTDSPVLNQSDGESPRLVGAYSSYGAGRNYTSNTSTPSPGAANLRQIGTSSAEVERNGSGGRHNSESRILSFFLPPNQQRASAEGGVFGSSPILEQVRQAIGQKPRSLRPLPRVPESLLELPDIRTDYHSNLMSWRLNGQLTVPVGPRIHMWQPLTDEVSVVGETSDELVTISVAWDPTGTKLAHGSQDGTFSITNDIGTSSSVYKSGNEAVRCIAWTPGDCNSPCVFTGDEYGSIRRYDTRDPNNNGTAIIIGQHTGPVLSLEVSPDGRYLASSGADSYLRFWSRNTGKAVHSIKAHLGPVNAVSWCPWQPALVATGDGSEEDATIRVWNINSGCKVAEVNTSAQINSVLWSSRCRELVSAHGGSRNAVCLWRWPTFDHVGSLVRDDDSIVSLAISPDGATLAAISVGECLQLWKCFEGNDRCGRRGSSSSSLLLKTIR